MLCALAAFAVSETEEIPTIECVKPKVQRKKKEKKGKKKFEDKPLDTKLPSLRTAEDVISRIHWDSELDREHFIVGYLDRFLGVIEKDFNQLSWEDIASVDYDTLAVPKHRIQYFKYKKMKVWDKNEKLDLVFGSYGCNKTIHEVILEYKDDDHEEEKREIEEHLERATDDSDSDDDIVITTGCEEKAGKMTPREKYWGKKLRPTHFLALRITNPAIRDMVSEVQSDILDKISDYADGIIPCERLHITLCCLGLDTEEAVMRAADKLESLKAELSAWQPQEIEINIEDVDNFHNNCLYAKVTQNQNFLDFGNFLRTKVYDMGIDCRDVFDFVPHMTLLKLPRQKFKENHTRYFDARMYTSYLGKKFGTQTVDNIHLCSMSDSRSPDGFYECATSIHFP
ncbi:hypothetical protein CAPTEDRAFT_103131 [Capitella teleta]|uniref:MJ1316 RNA cyclic group end recognition domain-containing protein n=1 Tax=Capitella teleta TaxID=283909 RepID=R7UGI9_CAPTE|nr:hypothetical protein CAPTEDRAFT_103131 [Capitella teleta]|eukprot:ELU05340.1 hypothetical protein CAPTEDRAFT_103131 [Capitella teleta]